MDNAVRYLAGFAVYTGFAERFQKPILKIWWTGWNFVDRDAIWADNDDVGKGAADIDPGHQTGHRFVPICQSYVPEFLMQRAHQQLAWNAARLVDDYVKALRYLRGLLSCKWGSQFPGEDFPTPSA